MSLLYELAMMILIALLVAKILGKLKLPHVTGYLIAGLLIGPSFLNIVSKQALSSMGVISDVALGIIAYSAGSQLDFSSLKKVGKSILLITLMEALTAFLLVTLCMLFIFNQSLPFSLVIGSIACATAPAATLMVIKQYKAKGPVVSTLIPVVALDDGVCIMTFGIASTIAKNIISGSEVSFFSLFIFPVLQIVAAIALGAVAGFILLLLFKYANYSNEFSSVILAVVFLLSALSEYFDLSALLVMLAFGSMLANTYNNTMRIVQALDGFSGPILIVFFVISGADLELSVLTKVGLIGVAYVIVRMLGKILGASIAAKVSNMPSTVQKYLGITLIPQAGVAIGLSMIAQKIIPHPYGEEIRTIILAGTIIYELIGPLATKWALTKANEILPENLK